MSIACRYDERGSLGSESEDSDNENEQKKSDLIATTAESHKNAEKTEQEMNETKQEKEELGAISNN